MKKEQLKTVVGPVLFMILGFIIFLNPDLLVKVASYGLGVLLISVGVYKTLNYYIQDKRHGIVNNNEMAFGMTSIILGFLFIFLAGTIELLLRIIVGVVFVMVGINKIFKTFYIDNRDAKYYALLVIGIIFIGLGLYIIFVSNLVLSTLGLFMMIYGIVDLVSFFVYKDTKVKIKYEEEVVEEKETEDKKEIIIETEFEEKEETKPKKSSKKTKNKDTK